jgi:GNAT superfamily N-acetyltransferase
MPSPNLRPMVAADIEPASVAMAADDWGDRRTWFSFAVASSACRPFVAVDADGDIAGTGVATINGRVGWIGTIWVRSDLRRRGLGRALTEATIDAAETDGCRTLVLVATDRGRPLYEGLGFEVETWYRTMDAPAATRGAPPAVGRSGSSVIRTATAEDLDDIVALDRDATGEDRAAVLRQLVDPGATRVVASDGQVRAFLARAPWGGGATIAPSVEDAMALLAARRMAAVAGRRVRCGILLGNVAGAAALEADGWIEAWRAPRMIRGDPLDWHPEHIWGQFNHALG